MSWLGFGKKGKDKEEAKVERKLRVSIGWVFLEPSERAEFLLGSDASNLETKLRSSLSPNL
jgi:hypothetical protein